jgi:hypothetical protein
MRHRPKLWIPALRFASAGMTGGERPVRGETTKAILMYRERL